MPAVSRPFAATSATKWEYMMLHDPSMEALNAAGEDGWELVGVVAPFNAGASAYFKRPIAHAYAGT